MFVSKYFTCLIAPVFVLLICLQANAFNTYDPFKDAYISENGEIDKKNTKYQIKETQKKLLLQKKIVARHKDVKKSNSSKRILAIATKEIAALENLLDSLETELAKEQKMHPSEEKAIMEYVPSNPHQYSPTLKDIATPVYHKDALLSVEEQNLFTDMASDQYKKYLEGEQLLKYLKLKWYAHTELIHLKNSRLREFEFVGATEDFKTVQEEIRNIEMILAALEEEIQFIVLNIGDIINPNIETRLSAKGIQHAHRHLQATDIINERRERVMLIRKAFILKIDAVKGLLEWHELKWKETEQLTTSEQNFMKKYEQLRTSLKDLLNQLNINGGDFYGIL